MTIPASNIVKVTPGVLSAGGAGLVLNGLILSQYSLLPFGAPVAFPNALAVSNYFGANSVEAAMATTYFAGYNNGTLTPSSLLFSRFAAASIAAFLKGGKLTSTLATLQAITAGALTVTVDGVAKTTSTLNLSTAVSFSTAAALITTALGLTGGAACTYDSQAGGFVITSGTTGATSTITVGSGTSAATLGLTAATGAVCSQGSAVQTPTAAMNGVIGYTQNWAAFTTTLEPVNADKALFSAWTSAQGGVYAYACYDSDTTAASQSANTNCYGYTLTQSGNAGTCLIGGQAGYTANLTNVAAFVLGAIASLDFTQPNGRVTFAFKSSSVVSATAIDATSAANLQGNGYNFYGSYATANQGFNFFYPGSVSGNYGWLDAYIDALWLNAQIQLAIISGFTNTPSVPYNAAGYATIKAWAADPIKAAVDFGAIRSGVQLSAAQIAQVNQAAGVPIDQTLFSKGWYLKVTPATAQQRGVRQSPACTLWYTDGGSVQQLNIASVDIQ
jgi:hypothetical protein